MSRHLPPLNALRAFEAAARHLSFTNAAEELNVTPAAVSHQVKALEAHLGRGLFRRLNNALELTPEGRQYAPLLSEGFDKLAAAGDSLKDANRRQTLTVSVVTSVATKWLAPRLSRFYQSHPKFDIRVDATDRDVNLAHGEIDLSILYGPGPFQGLQHETLFVDQVFPVCSPGFARTLKKVTDLRKATLLHIDWAERHGSSPDWSAWLAAAEATAVDATRGPRFTLSSMAMDAAIAGEGVALGQNLFASGDIAAGRLVRPFPLGLPLPFPYQLVWPAGAESNAAAVAFRAWVLGEVSEYRNRTRSD